MPIIYDNNIAPPRMVKAPQRERMVSRLGTRLKALPWRSLAINTLGAVAWVISSTAMLVLGFFILGSRS